VHAALDFCCVSSAFGLDLQCVSCVLVTLSLVCCLDPQSRVFLKGYYLGKLLHCPLLKQGFTYSPVSIDLRVSWVKFWLGRVWVFCVFVPVTLKLGGLKVPSTFGIKDLL
jgi:hypothetical protein